MSITVSPDCRDANCQKCDEAAWNEALDEPATCQCVCHHPEGRVPVNCTGIGATYRELRDLGQWLSDQGLIPKPLPNDPRERALHLRKHRNTGPAKALPGARREYGARG